MCRPLLQRLLIMTKFSEIHNDHETDRTRQTSTYVCKNHKSTRRPRRIINPHWTASQIWQNFGKTWKNWIFGERWSTQIVGDKFCESDNVKKLPERVAGSRLRSNVFVLLHLTPLSRFDNRIKALETGFKNRFHYLKWLKKWLIYYGNCVNSSLKLRTGESRKTMPSSSIHNVLVKLFRVAFHQKSTENSIVQ